MRQCRPQPKVLQMVEIPESLREFFEYVNEMIETEDESSLIESDDLLQSERVYGGLTDADRGDFGFTFFPEPGNRQKWEFTLDRVDIANICEGSKTTLKLWGCQTPDCRCLFSDPEGTCFYCDYVDEEEGA